MILNARISPAFSNFPPLPFDLRRRTRNPKGLITAITSPVPGRSWAYGYDGLDRLISANNGAGTANDRSYAYDDVDNLIYNSGLNVSGLCPANPNLTYPAHL